MSNKLKARLIGGVITLIVSHFIEKSVNKHFGV